MVAKWTRRRRHPLANIGLYTEYPRYLLLYYEIKECHVRSIYTERMGLAHPILQPSSFDDDGEADVDLKLQRD